jgi:hypothetical protein
MNSKVFNITTIQHGREKQFRMPGSDQSYGKSEVENKYHNKEKVKKMILLGVPIK